ncbi:MAG TPA: hypothetical protein VNF46_04015 [Gammaproteobacteria bacterium]|nr:hypothetical protein [Gammaproteobacteria bacterium]
MNTRNYIKILVFISLVATLGLPLAVVANSDPAPGGATPQTAQDDNTTMYLGKIEVHGEKNIEKTLQGIKIGLEQPYSSDPKLADVVVCRIENQAGSHVKQWLTCGTNRTLAEQRSAIHTGMLSTVAAGSQIGSSCVRADCYENVIGVLNETLNSLPGNYLHTSVNGPALHKLLEKIPYPQGYKPPSATTKAPAAPTHD